MLPAVVYAFLTNASGALIVVIYAAIVVSQIVVRNRRDKAGEPPPVLPMWLFPWLSYVALAGMLTVLVAMAITPSHVDEFWASMVSIGVALIAYFVFRRGRDGQPA
jgi:GABA permease